MTNIDDYALHIPPGAGERVQLGGLGVIFKVRSGHTQGAAAVVEHTLDAGCLGAPPHLHRREDEISCVLAGELTLQVGERIIRLVPSATALKPRGILHTFWNAGAVESRFLEVITPGGFENYFDELARLVSAGGPPNVQAVAALRQRYDVIFEMDRVPGLLERYGLQFPGRHAG